jgi:acyl CoA:acetate/3-ketoacid CoA transferase alpha subunit
VIFSGIDDFGLGPLFKQRKIKRMICSFLGANHEFEREFMAGEIEVELTPQVRMYGLHLDVFVAKQSMRGDER